MDVLGGRTTEGEYGDIVATVVAKMMPKSAQVRGHRGHKEGQLSIEGRWMHGWRIST